MWKSYKVVAMPSRCIAQNCTKGVECRRKMPFCSKCCPEYLRAGEQPVGRPAVKRAAVKRRPASSAASSGVVWRRPASNAGSDYLPPSDSSVESPCTFSYHSSEETESYDQEVELDITQAPRPFTGNLRAIMDGSASTIDYESSPSDGGKKGGKAGLRAIMDGSATTGEYASSSTDCGKNGGKARLRATMDGSATTGDYASSSTDGGKGGGKGVSRFPAIMDICASAYGKVREA